MRPLPPFAVLTSRGYVALLCIAPVIMLGVFTPAAYVVAAALLVMIIGIAAVESSTVLRKDAFRVGRLLPDRMIQGEAQHIDYIVDNAGPHHLTVGIRDVVDGNFFFERDEQILSVSAHSVARLAALGRPADRGDLLFRRLFVHVRAGFGLLAFRFRLEAPAPMRVYPNFLQTNDGNSLTQRNLLLREGARRLRKLGQQGDREGVRAYRPGDPFRSIDFKASARRGSLMVAEYGMERGEQIILAVDCGRLMTARAGDRSMLDHAVGAALSIAAIARDAGDRIGLYAFAERALASIEARSGAAQSAVLADATARLKNSFHESDYELAAADMLRRFRRRSLIVVFTSLIDPAASQDLMRACAHLSRHHTVLCVVINDGTLRKLAESAPATQDEAFGSAVAMRLLDERRSVLRGLRAGGTIIIDAPAAEITMPLLDAYLRVKRGSPAAPRPANAR